MRTFRLSLRAVIGLAVAGAALSVQGQTREETLLQAREQYQRQDWNSAIKGFSHLIAEDESDVEAWVGRAYSRHAAGQSKAAIDDYGRVIALLEKQRPADGSGDPGLAQVYANRGRAHGDQEDWAAAVADYNRSLDYAAFDVSQLVYRAAARQFLGDIAGAEADLEEAISRYPDEGAGFSSRALFRYGQRDHRGAVEDYRRVLERKPSAEHATYARFFIWINRSRLGERAEADRELAEYIDGLSVAELGNWPTAVAGFLLGRIDEAALMELAATSIAEREREQVCEAWYYRGVRKGLAGDEAGAVECYQQCVATNVRHFNEYMMSRLELHARR